VKFSREDAQRLRDIVNADVMDDSARIMLHRTINAFPVDTVEDQPPPIPSETTGQRAVWPVVIERMAVLGDTVTLVIEDMRERDRIGRERYGTPLTAGNGRNHLVDAYQENLDLIVYLAAWLEETHGDREQRETVQRAYLETVGMAIRLRRLIKETTA
jgi:hypothetical protein